MFIYTARIPKRRLAAGCVTLLCCCAVVVTALILSAAGKAVSASGEVKGLRDNDDRLSYLTGLGWTVSEEPIATEELLVPDSFDESYGDYLALQAEQGFDLTRYHGKRVKRYTYEITNYPSGETGVQISLLMYKNTVIGGEVISPTTGEVLHGLAMPESAASQSDQDTWNAADDWAAEAV
jgi:hypothetical protein